MTAAPDFSISAQRTMGQLRQRFPKAFETVRLLKIGITHDIVDRTTISEQDACEFMRFYANTPAYLKAALRPGAIRYDLDGQRVGSVSLEERFYACRRLEEQAAERQARKRERAFRAALLEPVTIAERDEP